MENALEWDDGQIDDEFARVVSIPSLIRTLILEEGFTEVKLKNLQTGEIRILNINHMSLIRNRL